MSGSGEIMVSAVNTSLLEIMNITNSSAVLTCEEIQVKGQPLPLSPITANVVRSLQITYYISSFLLGLFLNGSLISIITCNNKLQNITYSFALQIVIVDLSHALVIYPTSVVNAIVGHFAFTELCSTLGLFVTFMRIARSLLMAMLVVDRFCTIYSLFLYNRNRTMFVLAMSLVSWVVAMTTALIPVSGLLNCYTFQQHTWACQLGEGCSYPVTCTAYRTCVTTAITVGLFLVLLLYVALLIKARKIRNKVAIEVPTTNESQEVREEAKKERLRERSANTTFFLLFLALVGSSFTPYLFFTFGNIALSALKLRPPPPAYTILAIVARSPYVSLIVLDPIVIMRNPEVRQVIAAIKRRIRAKLGMRGPATAIYGISANTTSSSGTA